MRLAPPPSRPVPPSRRPLATTTLVSMLPDLLDERSRPGFREAFGALLSRATRLDVALTHLRLSMLDLTEAELARLARLRLLLAQVSATALEAEAQAVLHRPERAANLARLARLLAAGRIEVRSAPLAAWAPDFSVFSLDERPLGLLVGPHRFDRSPFGGPTLASVHGEEGASRALARFEEIWLGAHDIRAPIATILARAERELGAPQGSSAAPSTDGGSTSQAQRTQGVSRTGRAPRSVDSPSSGR